MTPPGGVRADGHASGKSGRCDAAWIDDLGACRRVPWLTGPAVRGRNAGDADAADANAPKGQEDRQKQARQGQGEPLPLRLVVSEVRDNGDKVLARWLILTNVPPGIDAATVARWYYRRWRIESYHKLLKGAGQQVESWQQESASAMAKRRRSRRWRAWWSGNWPGMRNPAAELRQALVGLSGRQMKRGDKARSFTEPALLAGLELLLKMLIVLERMIPKTYVACWSPPCPDCSPRSGGEMCRYQWEYLRTLQGCGTYTASPDGVGKLRPASLSLQDVLLEVRANQLNTLAERRLRDFNFKIVPIVPEAIDDLGFVDCDFE